MSSLPNAKQSPRLVNGVLKFYAGDTFELELELELEDQDGEPVTTAASDTVKVVFINCENTTVKEFSFTGVSNNKVTLDFDAACTALFPKGEYTYDVYYSGAKRTTLANDNRVIVE